MPKEPIYDEINKKLEECYNHAEPYLDDEEAFPELKNMCGYCEYWRGRKHDYSECVNMPCFKNWLAREYLIWSLGH